MRFKSQNMHQMMRLSIVKHIYCVNRRSTLIFYFEIDLCIDLVIMTYLDGSMLLSRTRRSFKFDFGIKIPFKFQFRNEILWLVNGRRAKQSRTLMWFSILIYSSYNNASVNAWDLEVYP